MSGVRTVGEDDRPLHDLDGRRHGTRGGSGRLGRRRPVTRSDGAGEGQSKHESSLGRGHCPAYLARRGAGDPAPRSAVPGLSRALRRRPTNISGRKGLLTRARKREHQGNASPRDPAGWALSVFQEPADRSQVGQLACHRRTDAPHRHRFRSGRRTRGRPRRDCRRPSPASDGDPGRDPRRRSALAAAAVRSEVDRRCRRRVCARRHAARSTALEPTGAGRGGGTCGAARAGRRVTARNRRSARRDLAARHRRQPRERTRGSGAVAAPRSPQRIVLLA